MVLVQEKLCHVSLCEGCRFGFQDRGVMINCDGWDHSYKDVRGEILN